MEQFWDLLKQHQQIFANLRSGSLPLKNVLDYLRIGYFSEQWVERFKNSLSQEISKTNNIINLAGKSLNPVNEPEVAGTLCLIAGVSLLKPKSKLTKYGLIGTSVGLLLLRGLRIKKEIPPVNLWKTEVVTIDDFKVRQRMPAFACDVYDKVQFAFPEAGFFLRIFPSGHGMLDVSFGNELYTVSVWDSKNYPFAPPETV